MDFLKKHYEKVLLGVVLVGLAVAAALLPWMISSERVAEAEKAKKMEPNVKPLAPLSLSTVTELIKRMGEPMSLDFSSTNRLFNPVPWQRAADGTLKKRAIGKESGIGAVVVTKISPLYTTISLDSVLVSDSVPRYMIVVVHEAAAKPYDRRRKTIGASLNEPTKEGFTIREIKGPPENPTELTLELADTGELVSVTKSKPFERVDGYKADLKYAPDNKTWSDLRVGAGGPRTAPIVINNEDYIVVAISSNEVVLSAKSNDKKTSIPYNPGP